MKRPTIKLSLILTRLEQWAWTRRARLENVAARTSLFKEGQQPDVLHVLLSGSVQLSAATAGEARETIIEIVTAPDSFILAAVLTDEPYLMSATVLEPAVFYSCPPPNCAATSPPIPSLR